jgi:WD40 repeat protein
LLFRRSTPKNGIDDIAFSPDGTELAVGSHDGTVQLLRVPSGKPLGDLLGLSGKLKPVSHLAFSPDGGILVTTYQDGTIQLWSVRTQRLVAKPLSLFSASNQGNLSVAFSPDGREFLTGYNSFTLSGLDRVYQDSIVAWDRLFWPRGGFDARARTLCSIVDRNLTQAEWSAFVPGTAYRRTCPEWPAGS